MIRKYIHVDKEAENSYSFAVGDEIRKALVAPWKLPILLSPYQKGYSPIEKLSLTFDLRKQLQIAYSYLI